jgi:hypothetical protein
LNHHPTVALFDRGHAPWIESTLAQLRSSIDKSKGDLQVSDENLIRQSYEEMIRTVFAQFYQASILAKTAEEKMKAEQIFQTGVLFARQVRDRAVAILPAA